MSSTGGSAIRGSRVGAGPMGEQDRGFKAERITVSYYCSAGHEYSPQFAATVDRSEIPDLIDCPNCGLPAGQDKANPPTVAKHEPYKTHLAYVKERRTETEAKELLEEAVNAVRERRLRLAEQAKVAAKVAAKAASKAAKKPAVTKTTKTVTTAAAKTKTAPVAKPVKAAPTKSVPAKTASVKSAAKPTAAKTTKTAKPVAGKTAAKPAAKTAKKK